MEMLKRLEPVALFVMICGALNWGIVGTTDATRTCSRRSSGTGPC